MLDPLEFLERLAALDPRARKNVAVCRGAVSPRGGAGSARPPREGSGGTEARQRRRSPRLQASRAFDLDVTECPRCGGKLELLQTITDPDKARTILRTLGRPAEPVRVAPARAPPPEPWIDPA